MIGFYEYECKFVFFMVRYNAHTYHKVAYPAPFLGSYLDLRI
jgi:hypothetical protein